MIVASHDDSIVGRYDSVVAWARNRVPMSAGPEGPAYVSDGTVPGLKTRPTTVRPVVSAACLVRVIRAVRGWPFLRVLGRRARASAKAGVPARCMPGLETGAV